MLTVIRGRSAVGPPFALVPPAVCRVDPVLFSHFSAGVITLDMLAVAGVVLVAVTWLGYPLGIACVAVFVRPRPSGWAGDLPLVSIVIATRERGQAVLTRVTNCLETDYPEDRLEVVVATDGVADTTLHAAMEAWPRVRLVAGDMPGGKAAALNAGVRAARGQVLVFGDTFQRFEPGAIRQLVDALAEPGVGAAGGELQIPAGRAVLARLYWQYERWLRRCEARVHSSVGLSGSIFAMHSHLWQPLPAGLLLDDVYTPMRLALAGKRITIAAEARAVETRSVDPSGEYRRKVRTLTGVLQVCAWLPDVVNPLRNPIWFQFAMHKLFRMVTPLALLPAVAWTLLLTFRLPALYLAGFGTAALFVATWLMMSRTRPAQQLRDVLVESALLQLAVVMAGFNGMRRRWKVWHG